MERADSWLSDFGWCRRIIDRRLSALLGCRSGPELQCPHCSHNGPNSGLPASESGLPGSLLGPASWAASAVASALECRRAPPSQAGVVLLGGCLRGGTAPSPVSERSAAVYGRVLARLQRVIPQTVRERWCRRTPRPCRRQGYLRRVVVWIGSRLDSYSAASSDLNAQVAVIEQSHADQWCRVGHVGIDANRALIPQDGHAVHIEGSPRPLAKMARALVTTANPNRTPSRAVRSNGR